MSFSSFSFAGSKAASSTLPFLCASRNTLTHPLEGSASRWYRLHVRLARPESGARTLRTFFGQREYSLAHSLWISQTPHPRNDSGCGTVWKVTCLPFRDSLLLTRKFEVGEFQFCNKLAETLRLLSASLPFDQPTPGRKRQPVEGKDTLSPPTSSPTPSTFPLLE